MDKYYYFVAQLPTLFFGRESNMSVDNFLDEAKKWLDEKDYRMLINVNLDEFSTDTKSHRINNKFREFEFQLRTDIASWREAQRREQDYKPASFPISYIKEGNPLDIEMKFLEMRWTFIDELERELHFDLGIIILYYLKLQILGRLFTFNKEIGSKKFQKLYEVTI